MNQRLCQHLRKGIADDNRRQPDKRDAALHQYLCIEEVDQQPCHTEQRHQHGELPCTSVAQKRQKLRQACSLLVIHCFDADTGIPAQEQGADETGCTGKNGGNQQGFQAKAVINQSVACRTEQKACCAEICCMCCLWKIIALPVGCIEIGAACAGGQAGRYALDHGFQHEKWERAKQICRQQCAPCCEQKKL